MSDDLVARLRHAWDERERQLAEDERVALAVVEAVPGKWVPTYRDVHAVQMAPHGPVTRHVATAETGALGTFLSDHDPVRVLAEVERGRRDLAVKRRILAEHRPVLADEVPGLAMCFVDNEVMPCDHVRWLAEAEGLA